MNKTIVVLRHAKAQSAHFSERDFDRVLTATGIEDAATIGAFLAENNAVPDLIVASAAKRTSQTASIIAQKCGVSPHHIVAETKLYNARPSVYEEIIFNTDNSVNTLMLVGHNPGVTAFINSIAPAQFRTEDLPPCGVVAATINTDDWSDFSTAEKNILFSQNP
jgi:phosphohistidine phosphatase